MDVVAPSPPKPRRRRRWVRATLWVGVALIALWVAFLFHATWSLNQAVATLKRRGEPTTFAEAVAANERNAAAENGADLIREALAEEVRLGGPGDAVCNVGAASTLAFTQQEIAALVPLLAKAERIVELLDQSVALPPGPLTVQTEFSRLKNPYRFDAVEGLRRLACLLWVDVRFSASTGDSRRTLRRLKTLYLLSEQLSSEAFVFPQFVRASLISLANHASRTALQLADLSFDELGELANIAARIDRNLRVSRALVNERALQASLFQNGEALQEELWSNASSTNRNGLNRDRLYIFLEYRWIDLITSPVGLPARRRAAAQTLNIPNDVLELADTPPPWSQEQTQSFNTWREALNIDRVSINIGEGGVGGVAFALPIAARRLHRQLAMTQLAFRIRRFDRIHGKLPDRLVELCDASMLELPTKWFEGKPFVYSKEGRKVTIQASVVPEIAPANDSHREAFGILLKLDFTPRDVKGKD